MAKEYYGIPYALDSSYLDMEITIQNNDGIGFRPFPIKNILLACAAIASCVIMLSKTFISSGSIIQKGIFIVVWGGLCFILLVIGRTKQIGLEKIISLFSYMQPSSRYIGTRRMSPVNPLIRICGFTEIDKKGFIHYADGSIGVVFDIVGNASVLLFSNHKNAVVDRVDTFYRKMRPKITYHYITNCEAQNVYMQIAYFSERKKNLTVCDPDLDAMIDTNIHFLAEIIGNSYKSLHQYMVIQAPNIEEMNAALSIFYDEADNSELMFKFAEQLDMEEVEEFMKNIYSGEEKHF